MPFDEEVSYIDLSDNDEDNAVANLPTQQLGNQYNGNAADGVAKAPPTLAARKQLVPSAWEANELEKPLSPYARFFQDTVTTIKLQNPNCSFNELRQIVLNMWEALDDDRKNAYLQNKENCNAYMKSEVAGQENPDNGATGSQAAATSTANVANKAKPTATAVPSAAVSANANAQKRQKCIRNGCNNLAIVSPDWEDEYCSSSCVVQHCRTVFAAWSAESKREHLMRSGV